MLAHGEHVGQHLRGVPLIGQAVVDGYVGVERELIDRRLCVTAVFDGVEHTGEHASGVGHRLLVADLGGLRVQDRHLSALLVRRDLESHSRAGRGLAEDEGDDLVVEALHLSACAALLLEFSGEADEPVELRVGEIELPEQVASGEVHRTRLAGRVGPTRVRRRWRRGGEWRRRSR